MLNNKILIIDDEPAVVDSIRDSLKREEYEILTANNGKEGLAIYNEEKPILIILDLRMPVMDGIEFLEHLKLTASDPCFVIVLTGHGDDEAMESCFNLGISSFLKKPFNVFELIGMVKHCIALKYTQMELRDEIYEHKHAKKKAEHLASFPQLSINPILEVDSSGIITFYNNAALNVLEKPGMNKNVNLFLPEDINEILKSSKQADEIPLYREVKIENRIFAENIHYLSDFKVFRIYASDITEKRNLQAEAIHAGQLAAVGELAAKVAHEINNPINATILCAEILCEQSITGKIDVELAKKILVASGRISAVVKSLLSFTRKGDKDMESCSILDLLSETLTFIKMPTSKDSTRIITKIPSGLSTVFVCPQYIQQVFMNVLSNARYALNEKYADKKECKIIKIRGEMIKCNGKQYVLITFHDKGTGIPADKIDRIMEPFFTTKPRGKGTGLGLSISRKILSDYGGKMEVDSVEGKFTNVKIYLPAMK